MKHSENRRCAKLSSNKQKLNYLENNRKFHGSLQIESLRAFEISDETTTI